ncbi:MAG: oxidoreductase [Chlamydiales bacterium]
MPAKTVLITGGSRGIGRATAEAFAAKGYKVFATSRHPSDLSIENVTFLYLDVTDRTSIQNAFDTIVDTTGQLDVVVNNAGIGLFGPIEMTSEEDIQKQFDVNVYGVIRMIQTVLPHMRERRQGHIINVSSLAGIISNPLLGIYAATKHAVEALSESLAYNAHQWNLNVSLVEPGATATDFAENLLENDFYQDENNPYYPFAKNYREQLHHNLQSGQDPREIGELIVSIVENPKPHFRYQTTDNGKKVAASIFKDITGDSMIEEIEKKMQKYY